jgi:hypothetical protein
MKKSRLMTFVRKFKNKFKQEKTGDRYAVYVSVGGRPFYHYSGFQFWKPANKVKNKLNRQRFVTAELRRV